MVSCLTLSDPHSKRIYKNRGRVRVARRCLACRAQRGPLGVLPKAKRPRIYFGLNMRQGAPCARRTNCTAALAHNSYNLLFLMKFLSPCGLVPPGFRNKKGEATREARGAHVNLFTCLTLSDPETVPMLRSPYFARAGKRGP